MKYATRSRTIPPPYRKNRNIVPNPHAAPKRFKRPNCRECCNALRTLSSRVRMPNRMRTSVITSQVQTGKAVSSKTQDFYLKQLYFVMLLNRHLIPFFNHYSRSLRRYVPTRRKIHRRRVHLLRFRAAPATSKTQVN